MKTIVCGPPHSGKSVLISNLQKLMPSDDYLCIRANGDGEGLWTNNPNQQEVDTVRKDNKSGNTTEDFNIWRKRIESINRSIVIVDIGGRLSDDKISLFEASDSFIIISSDAKMKDEWKAFGEKHVCRCLATIDSTRGEDDTVIAETPYLQARLGGLDRGKDLRDRKVVRALADLLVCESGYRNIVYYNCYKVAEDLGCTNTWMSSNGVKVSNAFFQLSKAFELYRRLKADYEPGVHYRILGAEANWVAVIAAGCLSGGNPSDISFFDRWTGRYITPHKLQIAEQPENNDIIIKKEENASTVLLEFSMRVLDIDPVQFVNYQLPVIDEHKTLLVSGRFPNWFTVSVMMSYHNREKYFRIPGLTSNHTENYVCVESDDECNLGQIFKS
jgi:hypothetical protein